MRQINLQRKNLCEESKKSQGSVVLNKHLELGLTKNNLITYDKQLCNLEEMANSCRMNAWQLVKKNCYTWNNH